MPTLIDVIRARPETAAEREILATLGWKLVDLGQVWRYEQFDADGKVVAVEGDMVWKYDVRSAQQQIGGG